MTRAEMKKLFTSERKKFARYFSWVESARLRVVKQGCVGRRGCRPRDLAEADLDTNEVFIVDRALDLPRNNIVGLLRHELGHLADPHPFLPRREQVADDIAEYVTGQKIRYDKDRVQTIGKGTYPRPKSLHR